MSGGSEQKETPHDKQCPHCGLWYMERGNSFKMHKASCSGQDETDADSEPTQTDSQPTEEPVTDTSSEPTGPTMPERDADDGPPNACANCGNPNVRSQNQPPYRGDSIKLPSGRVVDLEEGERICPNCGYVTAPDGSTIS